VNRHLAHAFFRLVCTLVVVVGGFYLLQEPWRKAEVRTVVGMLSVADVNRASHVYGTSVLVAPEHAAPFLAVVAPSCSALGALLAFSTIAMFLVSGPLSRRALAAAVAGLLVVIVNLVRIALSLGVGVNYGSQTMVTVHDWIGTLLGLFAVLAGFTVFMYLLLPHDSERPEANVGR
jgi:exosortase/archaeosortase family protein